MVGTQALGCHLDAIPAEFSCNKRCLSFESTGFCAVCKCAHISRADGQQHSKEFEAISVLRKVPVLREGSFILNESVAILLYLTRKYSTSIYWYPPDMHIRASIDEYMAWQHEGIHIIMEKILWTKLLIPMITGQEVPKERMDDILKQVQTKIQLFCDHFLKDKPFITGEIICVADLMAAVEMMQPVGANYNIFLGKPKLNAWRLRVEKTIGSRLFQEAHEKLLKINKWDPSVLKPSVKEKILNMMQSITE
ncbi:glutathione S-transferase theta-4-like [Trichosurus vulpecula]|uniref:glutathione S-transferase theta-4-like n=1 Tax=Trichosurus vulpecula TaxID=9337 RepID=UPI00186B0AA1|nr:glutathione S-transferase theta-4-like [Trichosurus vulpecula]